MKGPDGKECSEFTDGSIVSCSGRRTSNLKLDNPTRRRVEKIQIDDCVIKQGLRCDWLLRTDDSVSKQDIFVELKGSDIEHAVRQLEESLRVLARDSQSVLLRCYVVHTRCPMTGTDLNKHKLRFQRWFHARLETIKDGKTVSL